MPGERTPLLNPDASNRVASIPYDGEGGSQANDSTAADYEQQINEQGKSHLTIVSHVAPTS